MIKLGSLVLWYGIYGIVIRVSKLNYTMRYIHHDTRILLHDTWTMNKCNVKEIK